MTERLLCLDTSVIIKCLAPDEQNEAATNLIWRAVLDAVRLVVPDWAWAEVGSVLCKKARAGLLTMDEATGLWGDFRNLPIEAVDVPALAARAWEIAAQYNLPTLYDTAFLACTEVAPASEGAIREFWTADREFVRQLGAATPPYVRVLGA